MIPSPTSPLAPVALGPRSGPASHDPARVAEGFESLFISMLLEPLSESGAFFGPGPAGRTFGDLFREQLAENLSRQRPLGVADRIEAVLRRTEATREYGKARA